MTTNDNAALASRLYGLFNEGRLDAAADLAHPDVTVDVVAFGAELSGRSGFLDFMAGFKTAFPDLKITVVNQVTTADRVVSECSWTGTHEGPLRTPAGEIPPTGKKVTGARFCEVWTISAGRITRLVNYQDVTTWLRQLGLAS